MSLKQRLTQGGPVVAPGIYDALTASLATEAGFDAVYLSGAAIAYTQAGQARYRAGLDERGGGRDRAGARPGADADDRRCR